MHSYHVQESRVYVICMRRIKTNKHQINSAQNRFGHLAIIKYNKEDNYLIQLMNIDDDIL